MADGGWGMAETTAGAAEIPCVSRAGAATLPAMSSDSLLRQFTDENRVRAFAAVTLGAGTPAEVAEAAGLSPKNAAVALWRLSEHGVIEEGEQGLEVAYSHFREAAREEREAAAAERPTHTADPDAAVLQTFVRDGRLVRLPAQWRRKLVVLRHIAEQTFEPGAEYPERLVNEKLQAWCEGSPVDHATLRRYLVDLHHLDRAHGNYWRPEAAA